MGPSVENATDGGSVGVPPWAVRTGAERARARSGECSLMGARGAETRACVGVRATGLGSWKQEEAGCMTLGLGLGAGGRRGVSGLGPNGGGGEHGRARPA